MKNILQIKIKSTMKYFIPIFLILLFVVSAYNAQAADEGVISGKMVNKTSGGSNVSKIKVTLNGTKDKSPIPDSSTGTNDKGDFEFKGLSTDKANVYKVTANYQGADYESDSFTFQPGEKVKAVDLVVYDATADSKEIKINLSHMIVLSGNESLQAQEYYALANGSDKTYTGSRLIQSLNNKETFTTSLPQGANSVEYLTGLIQWRVAQEQGNLIDTMAIIPGVKEIAFGYQFPYKSNQYTFSKTFEYPVDSFNFVVEGTGMQITGGGLVSQGPVNINGKSFLVFNRQNIGANETLKINISGLSASPITGSLKWWALGFFLLAVAAVISYPRLRKRNTLQTAPVNASEREKLIKQIARLDDDFEEGRIPEETYQRLRSQKKARLTELIKSKGRKGL